MEETLGSCLDKMKERDVLSLPILDAKKGFVGFVSVERCLRVFLENAAIFLFGEERRTLLFVLGKYFFREPESDASND